MEAENKDVHIDDITSAVAMEYLNRYRHTYAQETEALQGDKELSRAITQALASLKELVEKGYPGASMSVENLAGDLYFIGLINDQDWKSFNEP